MPHPKCCLWLILWAVTLARARGQYSCSRQLSKQALSVIEKVILPIYQKRSLEVPKSCPFQPVGTRYYDNEKRTFAHSHGNWQCGYCGKSFYRESSLWRHFENKHFETVANTSCLADLCPILRCDVLAGSPLPEGMDYWQQALCKENRMLPLMERCMATLEFCLPATSDTVAVKDELGESLCDFLTCDNYFISHRAFIPRSYASQLWKVVLLVVIFYGYYIFVCMHMCDSLGVPRDSRNYFSYKRR